MIRKMAFSWLLPVGLACAAVPDTALFPPEDGGKIETPAPPENWAWLDRYQQTFTRVEFETKLKQLFDPFGGMQPFLSVNDHGFTFTPDPKQPQAPLLRLDFTPSEDARKQPPRFYRTPEEFRELHKPPGKPLLGLRVAIDPGHIGGVWGDMENRSTPYSGIGRIQEGDCNIITARLLRDRLQDLGASVFLTREDTEPVTPLRPQDLLEEARNLIYQTAPALREKYGALPPEEQNRRLGYRLKNVSELLFYRSAEILARGRKIHRQFRPDITITLYINATPSSEWHRLIAINQVIFFVHGAYLKKEAADPRQQFRFFYKLLDNTTPVEVEVATAIAEAFRQNTGLPAVPYENSDNSREVVAGYKYVVARNLAASRVYDGPVVCTEPYFMNNSVVARRLEAGDYDGVKTFLGKNYQSIYREYAENVLQGLVTAYGPQTPAPGPMPPPLANKFAPANLSLKTLTAAGYRQNTYPAFPRFKLN